MKFSGVLQNHPITFLTDDGVGSWFPCAKHKKNVCKALNKKHNIQKTSLEAKLSLLSELIFTEQRQIT